MIKPIFYNSAKVSARERVILKKGSWRRKNFAVRWALLPQTPLGPCLIDTGYSALVEYDYQKSWGLNLYYYLLNPSYIKEGQIEYVLQQHGLTNDDVSLIIVTHFHTDHISALKTFHKASILTSKMALEQILHSSKLSLWLKGIFTELLPQNIQERTSMMEDCYIYNLYDYKTYDLFQNGQCLALPLPGHARGHFGLVFPDEKLIYAVDCAWTLKAFAPMQSATLLANIIMDNKLKAQNSIQIIREFMAQGYKVMLSHEPEEEAHNV